MKSELTHEVLARGVCISGGNILLCRAVGSKRSYLPGGHIDPGEAASEALTREIKEELGLESAAGGFLGSAEHFFISKQGPVYELNFVFHLSIPAISSAKAPQSAESYIEFFWQPLTGLADAGFEPAALGQDLPEWLENGSGQNFSSSYQH